MSQPPAMPPTAEMARARMPRMRMMPTVGFKMVLASHRQPSTRPKNREEKLVMPPSSNS